MKPAVGLMSKRLLTMSLLWRFQPLTRKQDTSMQLPLSSIRRVCSLIMEGSYSVGMDIRDSFHRRFALTSGGIFMHPPFSTRSLWIEWRETSVGFGLDRSDPNNAHFFVGRIQGILSLEKRL